jgi:hypothetical protein
VAFIQKLGRNRYRARYRGPDGRERSKVFPRKADAARFLSSVETDKARGEWIDPTMSRTSFSAWASRWSDTIVHLKPKTRAGYESLLRAHVLPRFGRTPLGRIQPVHVREWVAALAEQVSAPPESARPASFCRRSSSQPSSPASLPRPPASVSGCRGRGAGRYTSSPPPRSPRSPRPSGRPTAPSYTCWPTEASAGGRRPGSGGDASTWCARASR